MNNIYYIDISNISIEDINLSLVSEERLNKCNLINEELKKKQSLISYLLLRYAFNELNIELNNYSFEYVNNKPFIPNIGYHFNITHSKNIVAVVISDKEVGIDCEYIDITRSLKAKDYLLSDIEKSEFDCLDDKQKYLYFYSKWVAKEAHFKMLGLGLTKEFKNVSNLDYKITEIFDLENNRYFITSTYGDYQIKEVKLNNINN